MKTFATNEKRSAPAVRKACPYVHHPMGPVQQAQQAEIRSILRSTGVQAKLIIGQSKDKYEQEADRVANQVMTMPDPKLQRQPDNEEEEETVQTKPLADQIMPLVQRQEETPEEEEEAVQTKTFVNNTAPVTAGLQSQIKSLKGGGQPLPATERAFFEPRFGADFSHVRIHNDSVAINVAQSINARAFTRGRDVVFGNGEYAPGTSSGRRLLAHELAHTLQQRTARSDSNSRIYRKTPKFKPASLSMAEWNRLRGYWKRQTRIFALQGRRISSKRWMKYYRKQVGYNIGQYEGVMKASKYLAKAMRNVTAVKNTIRALNLIAKIKGNLPKKYTPKVDVDITNALSYGPKILGAFLPILIQRSLNNAILMAYLNNDFVAADMLMSVKRFGFGTFSSYYKVLLKRYLFRTNFYRKRLKKYINYHRRETAQLRLLKRQIGLHVFEYSDKMYLERNLIFKYVAGPIYNYPNVILKSWKVRPIDLSKPYY
jgi:hypothetical protein